MTSVPCAGIGRKSKFDEERGWGSYHKKGTPLRVCSISLWNTPNEIDLCRKSVKYSFQSVKLPVAVTRFLQKRYGKARFRKKSGFKF